MSPLSSLLRSTWKKKSKGHQSTLENEVLEEENGQWDFGARQSEDGRWLTSVNGQRVEQANKWHQASSSSRKMETLPQLPSSSSSSTVPSSSTSSSAGSSYFRSAGPLSNGSRRKGHEHGNLDSVDDEIASKTVSQMQHMHLSTGSGSGNERRYRKGSDAGQKLAVIEEDLLKLSANSQKTDAGINNDYRRQHTAGFSARSVPAGASGSSTSTASASALSHPSLTPPTYNSRAKQADLFPSNPSSPPTLSEKHFFVPSLSAPAPTSLLQPESETSSRRLSEMSPLEKFNAKLSSPTRKTPTASNPRPAVTKANQSDAVPRSLEPKRSMPQLKGIWEGFLKDAEEDVEQLTTAREKSSSTHNASNVQQKKSMAQMQGELAAEADKLRKRRALLTSRSSGNLPLPDTASPPPPPPPLPLIRRPLAPVAKKGSTVSDDVHEFRKPVPISLPRSSSSHKTTPSNAASTSSSSISSPSSFSFSFRQVDEDTMSLESVMGEEDFPQPGSPLKTSPRDKEMDGSPIHTYLQMDSDMDVRAAVDDLFSRDVVTPTPSLGLSSAEDYATSTSDANEGIKKLALFPKPPSHQQLITQIGKPQLVSSTIMTVPNSAPVTSQRFAPTPPLTPDSSKRKLNATRSTPQLRLNPPQSHGPRLHPVAPLSILKKPSLSTIASYVSSANPSPSTSPSPSSSSSTSTLKASPSKSPKSGSPSPTKHLQVSSRRELLPSPPITPEELVDKYYSDKRYRSPTSSDFSRSPPQSPKNSSSSPVVSPLSALAWLSGGRSKRLRTPTEDKAQMRDEADSFSVQRPQHAYARALPTSPVPEDLHHQSYQSHPYHHNYTQYRSNGTSESESAEGCSDSGYGSASNSPMLTKSPLYTQSVAYANTQHMKNYTTRRPPTTSPSPSHNRRHAIISSPFGPLVDANDPRAEPIQYGQAL